MAALLFELWEQRHGNICQFGIHSTPSPSIKTETKNCFFTSPVFGTARTHNKCRTTFSIILVTNTRQVFFLSLRCVHQLEGLFSCKKKKIESVEERRWVEQALLPYVLKYRIKYWSSIETSRKCDIVLPKFRARSDHPFCWQIIRGVSLYFRIVVSDII